MDIQELAALEEKGEFLIALDLLDVHEFEQPDQASLIKAKIYWQMGSLVEAMNIVENLVDKVDSNSTENYQIELLTLKIDFLIETQKLNSVDDLIATVLEIVSSSLNSKKIQSEMAWAKFLFQMGNLHTAKSSHTEAIDTYLKSLKLFRQLNAKREEGNVNARIGTLYRLKADFKKAQNYLKTALKVSQMIPNRFDEANFTNRLGMVYLSSTEFDKAQLCFESSISYYESQNNLNGLKKSYSNLGIVYRRKGNYNLAIDELTKGTDIAFMLNDFKIVAGNNNNIGNIHMDNGDLDLALAAYKRASQYSERSTDKRFKAILESNLGIVFQKKGQYIEALKHYEVSMELAKLANYEQGIIKVYHNVGIIYRLQGDPKKALPHFEYSLKMRRNIKDLQGMTWDLQYIGMIYFELTKYERALDMFEECYKIRKKIDNKITLSEILFLIISVNVLLGINDVVEKRFAELSEIHETVESSVVDNHYLLSKIKIDQSSRIMKKVIENEVYEEILRKNVINSEHTQEAELGHCNFLLLDYKSSGDDESLVQLKQLIVDLYDKVRKQENYQLLIELLVIEAKLSAAQEDFQLSSKFLNYAEDIADDKNLLKLKLDISLTEKEIKNDIEKLRQITGVTHEFGQTEVSEIDSYIDMLRENIEYEYESAVIFAADEKEIIEANLKFADLILKDTQLPPETKDALHFLELSLWDYRLLTTTYNILQRLENNAYYSHPQSIEMQDLLQSRLQVFNHKQVTRKINLIDDQAQESIQLDTDTNLIVLIFDNLLQNTMKFTPEGGILEIKMNVKDNELQLEFSNDCRAVPEWVVPRLFQRFGQWQFDDETRKLGIGIGLTFIEAAIKYIGGTIKFISPIPDESSGAVVKINIPI